MIRRMNKMADNIAMSMEEMELELDKLRDLNSSLEKENENQAKVIEAQKREIVTLQTSMLRMVVERYGN
jgi:hypothetical protein